MVGPLDADNQYALSIYHTVGTQLAYDLHVAPMLLERFIADCDDDEVFDLFVRLNMIHTTFQQIAKDRAESDAQRKRPTKES